MANKMEELAIKIATPIADELGLEIVDAEYLKEGSDWFLRVYVDKEGGVGITDCEDLSRPMNKILDELDPVDHPYVFEVSSPGVERPLKRDKDFERYTGSKISVKLFNAEDGQKNYVGILKDYKDKKLYLDIENKILEIAKENIASAKLYFDFGIQTD